MSIGSFVECRTRSVTLPIIKRSKPPRPCVDIAIRSQPWTCSAVVSLAPCSAISTMDPATSLSRKSDQVIERLRFFNFCCNCSVTPAIYVFAALLCFITGACDNMRQMQDAFVWSSKMPRRGSPAGINAVSAKGDPSNATNAQTGCSYCSTRNGRYLPTFA